MSLTQFTEMVNSYEAAIAAHKAEVERLQAINTYLLTVCEVSLDWLTDWHEAALGDIPCGCKTCRTAIMPLRAAIAKAKGESK